MPEKPEIAPTNGEAAAIMQHVVGRVMEALSNELGYPLVAVVDVVCNGEVLASLGEYRATRSGDPQAGRIRIRFRPTGVAHRRLFHVDGVFVEDHRSKSFGGFIVRGDVKSGEGDPMADFDTWSVKRNDRDWSKWL